MMGKLYVTATPIGNLGDMTPRAVKVLSTVDFIAAEDTRVTGKLLNYFGIKTPMISYYAHTIRQRGEEILARVVNGESCAIVTDAGMPCISDPGEELVRLLSSKGIEVVVIPGASAAVSALAISGLNTSRFCFEGFLSMNKKQRNSHLDSLKDEERTMIFYEAPHKLLRTLKDMYDKFGDREISICRELTKLYEEVIRTTFSDAIDFYNENTPRGEFVLVISGKEENAETSSLSLEDACSVVDELVADGAKLSDACKEVSHNSGHRKSELYKYYTQQRK
ncbi:MAG: 16S rRNA (cytidine(1402)-2'-O)-methyltransferase [Clostridiales bacterium]|nr:16S rRNA (cytidine(1402)-2'-O)-methyltransferase [Clostridiales bacterium]